MLRNTAWAEDSSYVDYFPAMRVRCVCPGAADNLRHPWQQGRGDVRKCAGGCNETNC